MVTENYFTSLACHLIPTIEIRIMCVCHYTQCNSCSYMYMKIHVYMYIVCTCVHEVRRVLDYMEYSLSQASSLCSLPRELWFSDILM